MKKAILIPIITVSVLAVLAGASVGIWYALTPSSDSDISVVSASADSETGVVTVVLTCEENATEAGVGTGPAHQNRHQRNFAYMHQMQIKNATSGDELYQEQYQWQYRHRIQNGQQYQYQYQLEGLEQGQMLQLRIEYNNGKVLTYQFMVNH